MSFVGLYRSYFIDLPSNMLLVIFSLNNDVINCYDHVRRLCYERFERKYITDIMFIYHIQNLTNMPVLSPDPVTYNTCYVYSMHITKSNSYI